METITIGRDNSCDIVVNNPRVSRIHANISKREGNTYVFRDMSTNGTIVNGVMIKGSEMHIRYGDSVMLAGTMPLSWQKVQQLLPLDDSSSFSPAHSAPAADTVSYKNGTVEVVLGYIFAFLGGLIGVVLGLSLAISSQTVDGKKYKTYKAQTVRNGWIIFCISIVSFITWNIINAILYV